MTVFNHRSIFMEAKNTVSILTLWWTVFIIIIMIKLKFYPDYLGRRGEWEEGSIRKELNIFRTERQKTFKIDKSRYIS